MRPTERKPHIVFIVLDTHRLDRLGCYGYPRGTSPNLDAFSRQATLFEKAIAPAQWTVPSHASMFTGEPPSTHMAVQASGALDPRFKTLAEHLRGLGYRTAGFCNNPLVGIINNGLKRGFETFYNYGGAIPSRPAKPTRPILVPLSQVWERYTQILRKISYPIQNAFSTSSRLFLASLNPFWVSLWTRFAHFKGDTAASIQDAADFVRQHMRDQPHLLFLNLMETHLPYSPPEPFVRDLAPTVREERAARDFLRVFNTQALHWITPMEKPFSDLEAQTLSDMYDAEVAYQDHLLGELLAALDRPEYRENTMVIIVADHGEMLGEHQMMGHAFGVYQDLIRALLMVRFPGQAAGQRVSAPVSTTRLFHTVLEAAGVEAYETSYSSAVDVKGRSLLREANQEANSQVAVVSEAYAPEFALNIVETRKAALMEEFNSSVTHWAVYQGPYKLVRVEEVGDELFDLGADPLATRAVTVEGEDQRIHQLSGQLKSFLEKARSHRLDGWAQATNLDNEMVKQRLRRLGYLE